MSGRAKVWFWGCVAAQAGLMWWIAAAGRLGTAPTTIACGFALAFVAYAGLVHWAPAIGPSPRSPRIALFLLCAVASPLLLAPPVLSDDVYRYLWEGRILIEGFNPYELAPSHHTLAPLRDEVWRQVNHRSLASIYPPIAQALFATMELLGGNVWLPKLLALLVQGASILVISTVRDDSRSPFALGLNPLLLCEGPLNGHFDLLVGLLLLLAVWGLAHGKVAGAFVATLLAVGLKAVGLILVPLFVRRPRWLIAVVACSAALLIPMALATPLTDAASGVGEFTSKWRGNDGVYSLVVWVTTSLLPSNGTDHDPERIARAVVLLLWIVVALVVLGRRSTPLRGARVLVWAALLLSPQVHPWYLAWMLPIEVACGGFAGLVWSASIWTAYAPLDRWVADRVWTAEPALAIFQYGTVALALFYEWYRRSDKIC